MNNQSGHLNLTFLLAILVLIVFAFVAVIFSPLTWDNKLVTLVGLSIAFLNVLEKISQLKHKSRLGRFLWDLMFVVVIAVVVFWFVVKARPVYTVTEKFKPIWGPVLEDVKRGGFLEVNIGNPPVYRFLTTGDRESNPAVNEFIPGGGGSDNGIPWIVELPDTADLGSPDAQFKYSITSRDEYVGRGEANSSRYVSDLFGLLGYQDRVKVHPTAIGGGAPENNIVKLGGYVASNLSPVLRAKLQDVLRFYISDGFVKSTGPVQAEVEFPLRTEYKQDREMWADYGIITKVKFPTNNKWWIICEGIHSQGTEGAGWLITSLTKDDRGKYPIEKLTAYFQREEVFGEVPEEFQAVIKVPVDAGCIGTNIQVVAAARW